MLIGAMASATANWKRPWQDDDRNQTAKYESPGLSQGTPGHPSASRFRSDKEDAYSQGKEVSQGPRSSMDAKDGYTGAYTQGAPRDSINGVNHHQAGLQPSPAIPSKRARLDTSPMQDRRHEVDLGSRSFSQHAPQRPTQQAGYLEPRMTDKPPRAELTRRQGFMSLVGPPPYEPLAAQRSHDMSTLNGNRNRIREEIRRDCSVCEKAQTLAPQLASGLHGLHKQLRNVLDRAKPGSTLDVSIERLQKKSIEDLTSM